MSDNYTIRKLEYSDYYKNYLNLVNTFTRYPEDKSYDEFCNILDIINNNNSHIFVIECDNKIISSIKCIIEQKLHNKFKCVLHIEDLVTHCDYRKKGIATILLNYSIEFAQKYNCYKIVLCSNPDNSKFYLNNGFIEKGIEFSKYL
jgi:ribosomal protein S18 acetylase RimI-like enzyme